MAEINSERNDSRRAFIRRVGFAAWAVPTMATVNMTAAMAGGDVVTSVTPPTGPTTSMQTTTTRPPA